MKNIIYYISIFIVFLFVFYIFGFIGLIKLILFIFIYGSIFYFFYLVYKKLRKQKNIRYKNYLINFLKKVSLSLVIIGILIGLFGYYQNIYSPAKMTQYTISNGKKIVIFQEMAHIGSKNFYEKVKQNLINYKKNGFVYFFEGVKPGKKENMKKFNQAIGINFNKDLYKNFSKIYGVDFQDNSIYLGLVNNLDFNIDVDIDWIMSHYKEKNKNSQKNKKNPIDINSEIIKTLASLNEKELKILRFINKAVLAALIKSDKAQDLISDNFANKTLFKIILDGRNKILSDEIIKSKYNKIYITYGKLHFNGVLKLLQKNDKNWKIINKKEINVFN